MSDELGRADEWLHARLSGDTALAALSSTRIYSELADPEVDGLAVVFAVLAPDDVLTAAGNDRVMVDALYLVKATVETKSWQGDLRTAADRIDAVLHKAAGSVGFGAVLSCTRQRPFRLVENENGRQFRHLGGEYRVLIQHP